MTEEIDENNLIITDKSLWQTFYRACFQGMGWPSRGVNVDYLGKIMDLKPNCGSICIA